MTDELLIREDADGVAHLTMNAPAKLNALSNAMLGALQNSFDAISQDTSVKAVILSGAGKAFCAGHDLKEMTAARQSEDGGKAAFTSLFDTCARMMLTIQKMPQPVIAQVHGIATAAGCQLVASCDLAVAAEGTRFGVNGVNIGLFCSTPMVALSRNIPRKQAFEMLTTGEFIEATRAREMGLINRIAKPDALAEETRALAEHLATKLGAAVRIGKRAFYEQAEMSVEEAYSYASAVMTENMGFRDTEEGIAAFLEKRPPDWKD
ncbi:enoyl-CoA hydratase [Litoreibacter roseus]|uniref:Enoyl-CoA hydratase domain-containing protein 3, mitochondrial n=1 Tax=Litoreibacter roseus TaxID=2601869 RepID=A0A6N6JC30_9RHOB|nr:enoyl-CoA hydratase [Litoreibacter roseus]GFE63706.1 enoyl-CoA hydratase [Litoreibacter roseus]